MALEAVGGNMHMDARVIKVADFKSEVIRPPRSYGGCHGLGGLWRQDAQGIQGCRRRFIGPLPSCFIADH